MKTGFRAVKDEQKEERRLVILDAAKELFIESDLKEISMASVARKSGLAKGTLFFYFKTKEGLFLALAKREIGDWYNSFNERLLEYQGKEMSFDDLISHLDLALQNNSLVIRLFSLLDSTLEKNIDYDTASDFKMFMRENLLKTGGLIEGSMPFLKPGDGVQFLLCAYVLINGIYPMAHPSAVVQEVLKKPELSIFDLDFRETFLQMLSVYLSGLKTS